MSDRLLIVIPCLNEEEHLPALLDQFVQENRDALIVVADGGSSDDSRSIVAKHGRTAPNLILLDNPQRLQAAAVNLAVSRHGEGRDWLLRIDAHCSYPRQFARKLIEAAKLHQATSVVVPMITRGKRGFQIAAAAAQNSVLGTGGAPHRHLGKGCFVDHGHHALMLLKDFQVAGGYREDMLANEDAELDLRLIQGGARIWLEPSQAIVYYPRRSPLGLWEQYYNYGRGRFRTLRLHRGRPKLRQLAPVAAAIAAAMTVLSPISWWFAAPAAVWFCVTMFGGVAVGLRAGGASALFAGAAALIMHLAWGLGFLVEALIPRRLATERSK
jgi:succinoglycan biosynthesis protein ExoA